MNRDLKLVKDRRAFVKEFFAKAKRENPKISIKEIANELADWYLFKHPQTILNDYYFTLKEII